MLSTACQSLASRRASLLAFTFATWRPLTMDRPRS